MAGNPIIRAVADFISVLDELGIRYLALCTQQIDLVADLAPEQTEPLASKLNTDFYADAGQMREATRYGRAFNVIRLATGFKIDVFPLQKDAFHAGELARSERRVWEVDPTGSVELQVASAEDTVLEKLVWYKRGGQISDQQWGDVLGIATTRQLDREFEYVGAEAWNCRSVGKIVRRSQSDSLGVSNLPRNQCGRCCSIERIRCS